jgi:L-ascorbate metabolism protein UlaG (beta-lactamase superfamily)
MANPYYSGPPSDHFDGLRFFVPGHATDRSLADLLRWRLHGRRKPWPKSAPSPFRDRPPDRVDGERLRLSYVGHASVLLQVAGANLLVDPVWSQRASPLSFAGPRRVNAPGIALADLPPLDAVLVTHGHYDHLDLGTLSRLARERPCRVITALGEDAIMRRHDPAIAAEAYDWGARVALTPGVAVHVEPAYHWSARGLRDRRMALWCSFVIETPAGCVYYVSDTGFGDGAIFARAREKHGAPRLAIIPIGAYEPRWFMWPQHVDPDEAVAIFRACGAAQAVASHWGTFRLTDEAIDDPPAALAASLARHAIAPERFAVLRPGEAFEAPPLATRRAAE